MLGAGHPHARWWTVYTSQFVHGPGFPGVWVHLGVNLFVILTVLLLLGTPIAEILAEGRAGASTVGHVLALWLVLPFLGFWHGRLIESLDRVLDGQPPLKDAPGARRAAVGASAVMIALSVLMVALAALGVLQPAP